MSDAPPPRTFPAISHWCHNCNKGVSVETLADVPDVVCFECKNGFIEALHFSPPISAVYSPPATLSPDPADEDPTLGSHFLQMLRLLAQAARDERAPSQQPSPHLDVSYEDDFLRFELNGWNSNHDGEEEGDEDDDGEEEEEEEEEDAGGDENEENQNQQRVEENRSMNGDFEHEDDGEDLSRRQRETLRVRLRDYATRSRTGRNRILDWAEILMGMEDNSVEFRIEVPDSDSYIGNPGDYVDAAGYEALLQNLAESDSGRRGAPPAAKSAMEALETFEVSSEAESVVCAVCKDVVAVGETAKKLPCGHSYHGGCILPWLRTRNSCPICRFELPTDDAEYEEERKKRTVVSTGGGSSGSP